MNAPRCGTLKGFFGCNSIKEEIEWLVTLFMAEDSGRSIQSSEKKVRVLF